MALNRSEQMSRIRARNTRPEERLRRLLWARGLRYRIHAKVPGARPDIVFTKARVAVFVDGCFWHGCPEHYVRPRSRGEFWATKLATNVERDRRQTAQLEAAGWQVCRIWEHSVFEDPHGAADEVAAAVNARPSCPPLSWRVCRVEVADAERDLERRHLLELRGQRSPRVVERIRSTAKWVVREP